MDTDIEYQLQINKHRQEIIDALLRLHDKSDLLITIITLSKDPKKELIERFDLNTIQASAVLDLRKPLSDISFESIIEEKENLKNQEKELRKKLP